MKKLRLRKQGRRTSKSNTRLFIIVSYLKKLGIFTGGGR